MWEGRISRGSATPLPQGDYDVIPSAPQFLDSLLFMHTPFDAELPNLMCTCEGGLFLGGQPSVHPKEAGPTVPNFGGSFIFMHTLFVA